MNFLFDISFLPEDSPEEKILTEKTIGNSAGIDYNSSMDFSRPDNARTINRLKVLSVLRKGSSSRAELSRTLGINKVSVGEIISSLIKDGLITEGEKDFSAPGRPATKISVAKDAGRVFAFEVKPRSVSVSVSDLTGRILRFEQIPKAGEEWKENTAKAVERMKGDGRARIYGSALVSVSDDIPSAIPEPVIRIPPAIAEAAAEEAKLGPLEGMLFLSWSYSLDAAVRKGDLIPLPHLPHMRVQREGACRCGGRGCLEAAAGGSALAEKTGIPTIRELVRKGAESDAVKGAIKSLAMALSEAVQALSASSVMLTGEMSALPDSSYAYLQSLLLQMLPPDRQDVTVYRATAGDKGAREGAAAIALDAFFYSRPLLDRLAAIENLSSLTSGR